MKRSIWLSWGVLVAIDIAMRAAYLAPRLLTVRGFANYAVAVLVLWLLLRFLLACSRRRRFVLFLLVLALPMTIEWAVFRAYGQFAAPSDFALFLEAPRVVFAAGTMGVDRLITFLSLVLVLASESLLPKEPVVLRRRAALAGGGILVGALLASAMYWRASPSLEHPSLAFWSAMTGLATRSSPGVHHGAHVVLARQPPKSGEKLPNVVLVIGESLAVSHLSVYGYERDTSPRLKKLADDGSLVYFRDAAVMGPNTRTSVPYIMTGLAGPDPGGRALRVPTVLEYAKSRGYHTAVVSAQEEGWGNLEAIFTGGADTFQGGIHFASNVDIFKGGDDLAVLQQGALPRLKSLEEPFLLVLHMDGSHLVYSYHSPPSHKVFPEDGVNSVGAYDNTIRVTDEYLARVFEALRARDPSAWMFFTSDHGQPLGEGGAFFNHGYQTNVVRDPLFVFPPSDAPESQRTAIREASTAPVSACDLTPTIVHLMGATPSGEAPMDCADWFAATPKDASRVRVVSAYTPTGVREPTMLLLLPDGRRALYEVDHGTVVLNDGVTRPMSELALPPEVAARLAK